MGVCVFGRCFGGHLCRKSLCRAGWPRCSRQTCGGRFSLLCRALAGWSCPGAEAKQLPLGNLWARGSAGTASSPRLRDHHAAAPCGFMCAGNNRNLLSLQGQTSVVFSPRAMALKWDEARMNLPAPGKGLCSCCPLPWSPPGININRDVLSRPWLSCQLRGTLLIFH